MATYNERRKELLTQIQSARREYFRLKAEIANLAPKLPVGVYISNYNSNYKWKYYALGHKDSVLPSATDPAKNIKKLHLGHSYNPKYRIALLEVERVRIWQIKTEILDGITNHLESLKEQWRYLRSLRKAFKADKKTPEGKLLQDCFNSFPEESTFQFVLRQHYTRTQSERDRIQPPHND